MKKEITEYYCDVCGKKLDKPDLLKEIKIPIKRTMYSIDTFKEIKDIRSFELCPECINALYEVIKKYFADIRVEVRYDGSSDLVINSVKNKENKDEQIRRSISND